MQTPVVPLETLCQLGQPHSTMTMGDTMSSPSATAPAIRRNTTSAAKGCEKPEATRENREKEMTFIWGVWRGGAGSPPPWHSACPAGSTHHCWRTVPPSQCPHGWSAPAAPSHHVPEEAQRLLRWLRLVGASCPTPPQRRMGNFSFPLGRKHRGAVLRCPHGRALPAAPRQHVQESGSSPVPAGKPRELLPAEDPLPTPLCLGSDACRHLWHLVAHGGVPPHPWQVPAPLAPPGSSVLCLCLAELFGSACFLCPFSLRCVFCREIRKRHCSPPVFSFLMSFMPIPGLCGVTVVTGD